MITGPMLPCFTLGLELDNDDLFGFVDPSDQNCASADD